MDIFSFAMQMEKESENFYKSLAAKTKNAGFKSIFRMLAREETKHYKVVRRIKERTSPRVITDTDVLAEAKIIFERISRRKRKFDSGVSSPEVLRKALKIEKKSKNFYLKKADQVGDRNQRAIFKKLAKEENKHFFLLRNIIDFLARPETWLENAEWNHLEEY